MVFGGNTGYYSLCTIASCLYTTQYSEGCRVFLHDSKAYPYMLPGVLLSHHLRRLVMPSAGPRASRDVHANTRFYNAWKAK